jgi:hypothetical protein
MQLRLGHGGNEPLQTCLFDDLVSLTFAVSTACDGLVASVMVLPRSSIAVRVRTPGDTALKPHDVYSPLHDSNIKGWFSLDHNKDSWTLPSPACQNVRNGPGQAGLSPEALPVQSKQDAQQVASASGDQRLIPAEPSLRPPIGCFQRSPEMPYMDPPAGRLAGDAASCQ